MDPTRTDRPPSAPAGDDHKSGADRADDRRRRRLTQHQRTRVVVAIMGLSVVGALLAGVHPTDLALADVILVGVLAAVVPFYAAYARRWTWCWMAGVAGVASVHLVLPFAAALGALAIGLAATQAPRRRRIPGALIGALAIQSLLRVEDLGPLGLSAAATVVALVPVLVSGDRHMPRRHRRRGRRLALAAVVLAVVGVGSAVAAGVVLQDDLTRAVDRSEGAVANVGEGEQEATLADLSSASEDFGSARDLLGSPLLWPARALPVVGPHVGAVHELAAAGAGLTDTAAGTVGEVDYDRLRYQSGRINLAEVEAVAPALRRIRASLAEAEARTGRLDSPWLVAPLTERVDELRGDLIDTRRQADTAEAAVDLAPEMLGSDGPRRYLVVFPTESEARGGGGFVGNFVILDAVDGEVRLTESARIRAMIDARQPGRRTLAGLDDYLGQWGGFRPADFNQDILASPHFPADADAFAQVAEQSGRGSIDAVVSISPSGLAALLELTGPIPIPGRDEPVRPDEAEQFLQLGQYLEYADNDQRADALEALTRQVFDRLTNGTLPSPRAIGQTLGPLVPAHGIEVWSRRPEEEDLLGRLGVTGQLPDAGGHDLVAVMGTNGGPNKIDAFLHRTVEVEPRRDPVTGEVTSTVRVTLRNDSPAAGLPPYVIGNAHDLAPGTNRQLVSVYSPLSLDEARVDGATTGVTIGDERGYKVYSHYVEVGPGATATFELALRGTLPDMEAYRLVVPAQPMVNPDELVLRGPLVGDDARATLDRERTVTSVTG